MEPTDADWYRRDEGVLHDRGEAEDDARRQVDALFKKIAANSQLISGHTNQINALAAGQVAVVVTGHAQSTEQLQAKKAPIAFGPVRDAGDRAAAGHRHLVPGAAPGGGAALLRLVLRGKTPDGKAAGQKMLQHNGVVPANPYYPDNAFLEQPARPSRWTSGRSSRTGRRRTRSTTARRRRLRPPAASAASERAGSDPGPSSMLARVTDELREQVALGCRILGARGPGRLRLGPRLGARPRGPRHLDEGVDARLRGGRRRARDPRLLGRRGARGRPPAAHRVSRSTPS